MSNFIKSLAKIKENKICLFPRLHIFGKFVNKHDKLCLIGSLFLEPLLQFKQNVLVSEMFGDTRNHNMLKHLAEDTGKGNGPIVGRVCFIPFFENRGYICTDGG